MELLSAEVYNQRFLQHRTEAMAGASMAEPERKRRLREVQDQIQRVSGVEINLASNDLGLGQAEVIA